MFDKHEPTASDKKTTGRSSTLTTSKRGKGHLNRRSFFQFGLTAITAAIGVGSLGASTSFGQESNTHTTDFSEYV